mmetsp:Transcript_11540/g.17474  ORF Transcript_11540/g.17474 Transcript_11540/m.17474 type:complete len:217 (-) Transcript_11540:71-721(-)
MSEDVAGTPLEGKRNSVVEPRVKKIRLKKQSKKSPAKETRQEQSGVPTPEMHAAVVKALEKEIDRTEYPEMRIYSKDLEALLFETYPSDTGSAEFSNAFLKRLRSLRSRMNMVAYYLHKHHMLKANVDNIDKSELDRKVLSYLCTCPLEALATPDERTKIDAIRNDMLEKRLTAGALVCSVCGKIGKGHLNLNLMGLEQNNHWTNLFEDNMCQCTH